MTEVFNGPGRVAAKAVQNRALPKTNLHPVGIATLRRLQSEVAAKDRIPRRKRRVPARPKKRTD